MGGPAPAVDRACLDPASWQGRATPRSLSPRRHALYYCEEKTVNLPKGPWPAVTLTLPVILFFSLPGLAAPPAAPASATIQEEPK